MGGRQEELPIIWSSPTPPPPPHLPHHQVPRTPSPRSRKGGHLLTNPAHGSSEQPGSSSRLRLGGGCLAPSGVLFVFYPLLRPFSDEASLQGAAAFASPAWILAHLLAVVGFIFVALGLLGLSSALQHSAARRLASLALVLAWIGVGLILPYYG